MADYGFRLVGGRDLLDSASQRSAMEEIARFRHRRAEGGDALPPRGGTAASDAAAAALGMPPSAAYPGVRSRPHPSSAASAFGFAGEDPWFSLRPNRHSGVAMSGGRMGREAFGRSNASGMRLVAALVATEGCEAQGRG